MSAPNLVLIPREPTRAMVEAGYHEDLARHGVGAIWDAMVAAYEANTTPALLEGRRPAIEVALQIAIVALGQIGDREGQYHPARARIALRKISALVPHLATDR